MSSSAVVVPRLDENVTVRSSMEIAAGVTPASVSIMAVLMSSGSYCSPRGVKDESQYSDGFFAASSRPA
jgi:hypothetical protein